MTPMTRSSSGDNAVAFLSAPRAGQVVRGFPCSAGGGTPRPANLHVGTTRPEEPEDPRQRRIARRAVKLAVGPAAPAALATEQGYRTPPLPAECRTGTLVGPDGGERR